MTRILIVDDVPELRAIFRLLLETEGLYDVVGEAGDGLEAIEKAGELKPDLVILDMAMPRLDGLQAIPRIHDAAPGVRILVLSGFEARSLQEKAIESCATAFLSKGASSEKLISLVDEVAASPPKRRSPAGMCERLTA